MSIDDIKAYIRDGILMDPGLEIGPDDDLLLSNVLDSLRVMLLVTHLEERSGIDIPPEDVTLENFQSLRRIHDYVDRRSG
ncbi:MAG TPA: acyl carrier protein [Longimicrobiales bacterium]|nr:acyl carrier protein [Longimicrobiales bacterium]